MDLLSWWFSFTALWSAMLMDMTEGMNAEIETALESRRKRDRLIGEAAHLPIAALHVPDDRPLQRKPSPYFVE